MLVTFERFSDLKLKGKNGQTTPTFCLAWPHEMKIVSRPDNMRSGHFIKCVVLYSTQWCIIF